MQTQKSFFISQKKKKDSRYGFLRSKDSLSHTRIVSFSLKRPTHLSCQSRFHSLSCTFSPKFSRESVPAYNDTLLLLTRSSTRFRFPIHLDQCASTELWIFAMENGTVENGVCSSESANGGCDIWSCKDSDSSSADHLVVMVNGILGRSFFFFFFFNLILIILGSRISREFFGFVFYSV